jgi:hypothetical protein
MWHFIQSFDAVPRDRNLMVAVLDADCFHALEFPCRCNEDGKQSAPNPPRSPPKTVELLAQKTERKKSQPRCSIATKKNPEKLMLGAALNRCLNLGSLRLGGGCRGLPPKLGLVPDQRR